MRTAAVAPVTLTTALAALVAAFAAGAPTAEAADAVARGKYLVGIMGCSDCHTPLKMTPKGPVPDESRFLSGHPHEIRLPAAPASHGAWAWQGSATNTAFAGPWGVSYAANLTPDVNTGIGIWTEEMFVKTIRTGKHWGVARPIQPPMPWLAYRGATDSDLKAVYAYLRTIRPVRNLVPDYEPPAAPKVAAK
jgi:mono/diheme cytochrome c family protein